MSAAAHTHRHTIRNRELYIGKTNSLISLNLNNTAAVSIIDSCKRGGETVKSLAVGEEQVVNFSVHQTFFGFSLGGRNLPLRGKKVVEV